MAATAKPNVVELFHLGQNTPQWIFARDLQVDVRFQRPISERWVAKTVIDFDPDKFGGLLVSQRANGDLIVLDGQGRLTVIMRMHWSDQKLPCFVLRGLTVEREAEIYEAVNERRRNMTAYNLWRSKVFRKEAGAMEIKSVLDTLGLQMCGNGARPGPNKLFAVRSIEHTYEALGTIGLHRLLRILKLAFKSTGPWQDRNMLDGMALVLASYPELTDDQLIKRLGRSTPEVVLRKAYGMHGGGSGSLASFTGWALLDTYNKANSGRSKVVVKQPSELALSLRGLTRGRRLGSAEKS